MSTTYRIFGFKSNSEKFIAYQTILDNCRKMNIIIPEEVQKYFFDDYRYNDYVLGQGGGECIELTPPSMNNDNSKALHGVIAERKDGSFVVTLDLKILSHLNLEFISFGAYY